MKTRASANLLLNRDFAWGSACCLAIQSGCWAMMDAKAFLMDRLRPCFSWKSPTLAIAVYHRNQ